MRFTVSGTTRFSQDIDETLFLYDSLGSQGWNRLTFGHK